MRLGLCELVVPHGRARQAAENMAHQLARSPQAGMRADRRSVYLQDGLAEAAALQREWTNSSGVFKLEGSIGAIQFARGRAGTVISAKVMSKAGSGSNEPITARNRTVCWADPTISVQVVHT